MLASFSVGAVDHIDYLKAKLDQEFRLMENDGIKISCDEEQKGGYVFLEYRISDYGEAGYSEDDTRNIFRHYVANAVSDIILNNWEKQLIREIVNQNYYYFTKEEQDNICEIALQQLNYGEKLSDDAVIGQLSRKSLILRQLLEYLYNNNDIIIEGFIKFRLKDYLTELAKVADKAADDFLMDKEYKEFIRLLKYFVDIQEPRLDVVQVLAQSSGKFKLLDGANQNINSEYLDGFIIELGDSELNYEDLLISALITIAPTTVIIHKGQKEASLTSLDTIVGVFGDRVRYCNGCDICQPQDLKPSEIHMEKK